MGVTLIPWRIRWGVANLLRVRFWKSYFTATAPTPKLRAIRVLLQSFFRRTNPLATARPRSTLAVEGLDTIPIDSFSDFYIFFEVFVDACYDNEGIVSAKPVVLDIGANVGFFTLRIKQRHPQARVWCFEPLPSNFERLNRNIASAGVSDVACHCAGVSDRSGQMTLYVHPSNTGGHTILPAHAEEEAEKVSARIFSMAEALDLVDAPVIDLLKVDCEGAEKQIILSLTAEDSKRIRAIIYEPTASLYDPVELRQHLDGLGYATRWQNGLVFARKDAPSPARD